MRAAVVGDVLPRISATAPVISGTYSHIVSCQASEDIRDTIPGARLEVFVGRATGMMRSLYSARAPEDEETGGPVEQCVQAAIVLLARQRPEE
jgi:hypothetical protein